MKPDLSVSTETAPEPISPTTNSSPDSTPSETKNSPAPPVAVHLDPTMEGYLLTKNGLLFQRRFKEITLRSKATTTPEIMKSLLNLVKEKYPGAPENMMTILSMSLPTITTLLSPWTTETTEGLDLRRHPRIPYKALQKMVRAMRLWNDKFHSEITLLMHLDETPQPKEGSPTSDGRSTVSNERILILFPKVTSTTGASVRFELGNLFCRHCLTTATTKRPEKQYKCGCGTILEPINLLLTAHTHPNMEAFCSGTDDTNEKPHVAFHMTVGHIEATPTFVVSFCDGNDRFPIKIEDLFETPDLDAIDEIAKGWIALYEREKKDEKKEKDTGGYRRWWDRDEACMVADSAADRLRESMEKGVATTFFKEYTPSSTDKPKEIDDDDTIETAPFVKELYGWLEDKAWTKSIEKWGPIKAPEWLEELISGSEGYTVDDQAEEMLSLWDIDSTQPAFIDHMIIMTHLMNGEGLVEFGGEVLKLAQQYYDGEDQDAYEELERLLVEIYRPLKALREDTCKTSSSSAAAASATT